MQNPYTRHICGWFVVAIFLLSPVPVLAQTTEDQSILAAWVQYTANGAEVRAVVLGNCPEIQLNRKNFPMNTRARPSVSHPNTVCFIEVDQNLDQIVLEGQQLPVPVKQPKQIVVVGDTGCRLSDKHGSYQACDNNSVWPFAQVANQIGQSKPDLIIHTGDYIYRESACPEGNNGCIGTPYGDNIESWMADWLEPAAPLFTAAPIIAVRGNHESCERAGTGWFRYLGARANPDQCLDSSESWVADLGNVDLGVIDSANLEDADGNPLTEHFARQLTEIAYNMDRGTAWVVAHHPFWGVGADDDTGELVTYTDVLQSAVTQAGLPQQTQLLIGSHIHLVEVLDFGGVQPPQLVVGNGGTQLVNRITPPDNIDGLPITMSKILYQYGFATLQARFDGRWEIDLRDIESKSLLNCRLTDVGMNCSIVGKQCPPDHPSQVTDQECLKQ